MYIRLKRKNQTVFLHIDPSDNFSQIKQRVGALFRKEQNEIMLFASDKKRELLDLATISDQEIKDDEVVYMVFTRDVGGGWEELQADTLMPLGYDNAEGQISS